jgi:hypothetical protein
LTHDEDLQLFNPITGTLEWARHPWQDETALGSGDDFALIYHESVEQQVARYTYLPILKRIAIGLCVIEVLLEFLI